MSIRISITAFLTLAIKLRMGFLSPVALLATALVNGQSVTYNRVDIPTGINAIKVAIADFNGDGKNDIVYLLSGNGPTTVSVFLGNGNGTFLAPKTATLGAASKYLVVGDLNNDGIPDVVVDDSNNKVYVLLGIGDGTFQPPKTINVGASGIAIGDFNRDGKADLALITAFTGTISIFLGNGDGTFTSGSSFSTGGNGSNAIVTADFNRDGKLDLATVNLFSNNLSVLLGNGDGTFALAVVYPLEAGSAPRALAVGDINGDGVPDIIASETSQFKIAVLLGIGNGAFGAPGLFSVPRYAYDIAIADLNGDGKLDLAIATNFGQEGTSFATVLLGAGNGTFGTSQDFAVVCCAASIASGYLDLEGLPDLVLTGSSIAVSVLLSGPLPPPTSALSLNVSHSLFFTQGQAAATFTIVVSNAPGTLATSGTVTVTESLPAGLVLDSMSGAGWACSQNECSRADPLSPGASYPSISVTVDVQATAGTPLLNVVRASGGGSATAQASDSVNVNATSCTFSINPPSASFDGGGGSGGLLVSTQSGCSWTAVSNVNWLIILPGFGTGNGFGTGAGGLGYSVNSNPGRQRTGTLTVAGQTFTVNQAGRAYLPSRTGIFRAGFFWLEDVYGIQPFSVPPNRAFAFGGVPGDIPITGDWNGDGRSKVGVYRPSNGLFVLDYDGDGQFTAADKAYYLGVGIDASDIPVVGDWNGDGRGKVGLFRQGFFWILDYNGNGVFEQGVDKTYAFGGVPGDVPVVGDWDGSGTSKIGLFRSGFFWILDTNGNGSIDNVNQPGGDQAFAYGGLPGDVPVVGDWNGDGISKVGVFRAGFFWVLDANGNYQFDGTGVGQDLAFAFGGLPGDKPVVGKW